MKPTLIQLIDWAREAGSILRSGLGSAFQVDHKGEIDLVTEMDRRSEDYLIGQVRARVQNRIAAGASQLHQGLRLCRVELRALLHDGGVRRGGYYDAGG